MSATDQPIVHSQALVTTEALTQARPQRRVPGERLGHADHPPRVEGADRQGRLEHLPHLDSSAPTCSSPAVNIPLRGNGDKAWFGWPTDPKIEELIDAWFKAPDPAAQKKLADAVQVEAYSSSCPTCRPASSSCRPPTARTSSGVIIAPVAFLWNVEKK